MTALLEHGRVPGGVERLAAIVAALPPAAWTFRGDPESATTRVVRENTEHFPQAAVQDVLDRAVAAWLPPGSQNRIVLSCVPAGCEILPHTDDFGEAVRAGSIHCHIPLLTDAAAVMGFSDRGEERHLRAGWLYSMDESQRHYVKNPSGVDRVHLLFAHWPHAGQS